MVKVPSAKAARVRRIEELEPGLEFEYSVWASKGGYGDFPGRFEFELHGQWLVAAKVIELAGSTALTSFTVFENKSARDEALLEVEGAINPRRNGIDSSPDQYGTYPIQEGFSTIIDPFTIHGRQGEAGKRLLIPARNIEPGSLRVMRRSAKNDH